MRFTEAFNSEGLKNSLYDLVDYFNNWEEFNPCCPQEDIEKIKTLEKEVKELILKLDDKLSELGGINKDCYEY